MPPKSSYAASVLEYAAALRRRYRKTSKGQKNAILTEFRLRRQVDKELEALWRMETIDLASKLAARIRAERRLGGPWAA